jgi:hypothetical protein
MLAFFTSASPIYIKSSFEDSGLLVTETRLFSDGTQQSFEWLDLSITREISYNSLIDDLSDDERLNNSGNRLVGNSLGVMGLSNSQNENWRTVSQSEARTMLNQFFNIELTASNSAYLDLDSERFDQFFSYFTGTSGYIQTLRVMSSSSLTSTGKINTILTKSSVFNASVITANDFNGFNADIPNGSTSTWLLREAVEVNAPFTLGLFGLPILLIGCRYLRAYFLMSKHSGLTK